MIVNQISLMIFRFVSFSVFCFCLLSFDWTHILSGLIIFLLITILISCLLSSYSFSALAENFNDNCVTGAAVTLKRIELPDEASTDQAKWEANFYAQKVHELDKDFRSYYIAKELREADETGAIPKTQIYQFYNSKRNPMPENKTQPNSTAYLVPTLPSNDTEIFNNCKSFAPFGMMECNINYVCFANLLTETLMWVCVCAMLAAHFSYFIDQIREFGTRWGDTNTCLLYYYSPVIEITATIVWIVLILISRRQGEQRSFTYVLSSSMCVQTMVSIIISFYSFWFLFQFHLHTSIELEYIESVERQTNEVSFVADTSFQWRW